MRVRVRVKTLTLNNSCPPEGGERRHRGGVHQLIGVLVGGKGALQQARHVLGCGHRAVGHRLQQQALQAPGVLLPQLLLEVCARGYIPWG